MLARRSAYLFFASALLVTALSARVFVQDQTRDFLSFYLAARAGADLYDVAALEKLHDGSERVFPYLYSPLLAVVAAPLAKLRLAAAFRWWTFGSVLAFALASTLAVGRTRRVASALAVVLLLAAALDVRNVLSIGQVNTYVLVPLTASLVLRERRPVLAGAAFAVAGLLKSSPFALVVLFAAERRWRLLVTAAVVAAALAAATLPVVGVEAWRSFGGLVRSISRLEEVPGLFAYSEYSNFSFAGILSRIDGDDAATSRIGAALLSLLATLPVAIAAWRRPRQDGTVLAALVVMVLSSPLAYLHHAIYVLPAVAPLLLDAVTRDQKLRAFALLAATTLAGGVDFGALGVALGSANGSAVNAAGLVALYALGLLA